MCPWGRAKWSCMPPPKSLSERLGLCHGGFMSELPNSQILANWFFSWCHVQVFLLNFLGLPTHGPKPVSFFLNLGFGALGLVPFGFWAPVNSALWGGGGARFLSAPWLESRNKGGANWLTNPTRPPSPRGSLGCCTCAQEAICTKRRKKLGWSVVQRPLSQKSATRRRPVDRTPTTKQQHRGDEYTKDRRQAATAGSAGE